jgi:hypothetical protein
MEISKKSVRLILAGIALFVILFVVLGLCVAFVYGDKVKSYVIEQLNKQLNTQIIVEAENIHFSVLTNFPSASVEFRKVLALDAIPGSTNKTDTLFFAGTISLQFNIMDIFRRNYLIHKLSVYDVILKVKIDKQGNDNYHFWKNNPDHSSANFAFELNKIVFKKATVFYSDLQNRQVYILQIPRGTLSGKFTEQTYQLSTDLQVYIRQIKSVNTVYLKEKKGELKANFFINRETGSYVVQIGSIKVAELNFDLSGNIAYKDSSAFVDLQLKGRDLDISSALSLLPDQYRNKVGDYSGRGNFYFISSIKGRVSRFETPLITASFGLHNGDLLHKKSGLSLKDLTLAGTYTNKGTSRFSIQHFSGKFNKGALSGNASIENFENPVLNLNISANFDLANFQKVAAIDTIESIEGRVKLTLSYKGKFPISKNKNLFIEEDLKNAVTSGNIALSGVSIRFKESKNRFDSIRGYFEFDNNGIDLNNFCGRVSNSDFDLNGSIKNVLPFLFLDKEVLNIKAQLKCRELDLDELLLNENKSTRHDTIYELRFSKYLHLDVQADISALRFKHFEAKGISGYIALHDKQMVIDPVSFNSMDGKINGKVKIDGNGDKRLLISCSASLEHVSINKLFEELDNFGQTTLTDKNLRGILSCNLLLSSEWSSKLEVNPDKIKASAEVKIEKGELLDFKPLKSFSKFINLKELEDIKFSTLENQIEIRNRTIFIPKMELKNSALNLSCSGQHGFNNEIDYQISLLMRELMAKRAGKAKKENDEYGEVEDDGLSRTLFISMTGTVDHPVVKYSRKGLYQKIKEDIKKEKHGLKSMLKEEFGWFKKDSTLSKTPSEENQKKHDNFKVKWDENVKDDASEGK